MTFKIIFFLKLNILNKSELPSKLLELTANSLWNIESKL